jgi:hypothetical protein
MDLIGEKRREAVEFLGNTSAKPWEILLCNPIQGKGGVNAMLGFLQTLGRHHTNHSPRKRGFLSRFETIPPRHPHG